SAAPSDPIRWRAQRSRRTYELVSLHPGNPTPSTRRRTPRVISVGRRIATTCRVHQVPTSGRAVRAATGAVAGVAWAPTRGIAKVEVQVDDGEWQQASLADALNVDAWRQWATAGTPPEARIVFEC